MVWFCVNTIYQCMSVEQNLQNCSPVFYMYLLKSVNKNMLCNSSKKCRDYIIPLYNFYPHG